MSSSFSTKSASPHGDVRYLLALHRDLHASAEAVRDLYASAEAVSRSHSHSSHSPPIPLPIGKALGKLCKAGAPPPSSQEPRPCQHASCSLWRGERNTPRSVLAQSHRLHGQSRATPDAWPGFLHSLHQLFQASWVCCLLF